MDEDTLKIIKERFDALPKSIQEIILSSNYQETIIEIGKFYQLNVEKMGILERETTLVMMGLTNPKDFENELARELGIDKLKVTQIVKDINEKIFLKIRELLKLMNTPEGEDPEIEEKENVLQKETTPPAYREIPKVTIQPTVPATPQITKVETSVLNKAGIDIVDNSKNVPAPERLELESPATIKRDVLPILAQKLSGYVQNEVVETKHSVDNVVKKADTTVASSLSAKPVSAQPTPPKPRVESYAKGTDPYRLPPE